MSVSVGYLWQKTALSLKFEKPFCRTRHFDDAELEKLNGMWDSVKAGSSPILLIVIIIAAVAVVAAVVIVLIKKGVFTKKVKKGFKKIS